MYISVIICTYNRDKYIYNILKSIAKNDFPFSKYEILLVNNNSTDNTEEECNRFNSDYPQVNYCYFEETSQGLSYARNRGVKESTGDVILYVDDDATVNKDYLQSYCDFFSQNKEAMAVGGPIIPVYESKCPNWMSHYTKNLITGYHYHGNKVREFKKGNYPGGGNAAYRREVFDKTGLFNVDLGRKGEGLLGSEEKDIFDKMRSLGMKFYYIPNAILYHIIPDTKLTKDYFNRLTYSIGRAERLRTLKVSKTKYYKRLFSELIKWIATIILFAFYFITFRPQKGYKLIIFRWNVTKGLIQKNKHI